MAKFKFFTFLLLQLKLFAQGQYTDGPEVLTNPNFENDFGTSDWFCNGCTVDRTSEDKVEGQYSARITNRRAGWAGIAQNVNLAANTRYAVSGHIKLLNNVSTHLYHRVQYRVNINNGGQNIAVGRLPNLRQAQGWQKIGGDFITPATVTSARIYIQIPEPEINYLFDKTSLKEVIPDKDWVDKANKRIEAIRKGDVAIRLNITDGTVNPATVKLEVRQKRHEFAFGTAVKGKLINGTDSGTATAEKYRQWFYDNFEWAVIENDLKWRIMEWTPGNINYARGEAPVDTILARGIPVRGHCVFWGVDQSVPDWLKEYNGTQVRREMTRRVNGVVDRYRGRLAHWDVYNEALHGFFFEDKTRDVNIILEMFRETREVDPGVKLFLNDYAVSREGILTQAYANQAEFLKGNGYDISIGVQGHYKTGFAPDIHLIAKRMDILAGVSVPVWITEMDVENTNRDVRAADYEKLWRFMFSHPSVDGIMLWGFWDQAHSKPQAALVEGNDLTPNAAGLAWQRVTQEEWSTNQDLSPNGAVQTFNLRAFHGEFDLTVKVNGAVRETQSFSVLKNAGHVTIDVTL
ncbi:unnamed protein product [Owenia fusiformis]|uniref:Uncharacterized protein n=1 Tax=Owenia fusiformis TaxID=6347 RepID=A0A8J1XPN5_OWEFU|nr:unnamed protein product [Owenia fusiformis]